MNKYPTEKNLGLFTFDKIRGMKKNQLTGLLAALSLLVMACNNNGADKKGAKDSTASVAAKAKPGDAIKLDSSKRYIYLTWDDSPQPPGTVNCKNVFREQGVKATFFAVGFNQVGPWKKESSIA